jgi:hypothetical protein
MLHQRDILRRMSGRAGMFMPGAMHDMASQPVRILRTVYELPDGTTVKLAYDETLELQAIVTDGPTPISVTVKSHALSETHTLASGTGPRELALPSVTADKVRAQRATQFGPRWSGIRVSVSQG